MRKTIQIGSKKVDMLATGTTPIRYNRLFHKDLLSLIYNGTTDESGIDLTVASEVAPELAYVMYKAAEGADMDALSYDEYFDWLDEFEALDFVNASEDIFSVYTGESAPTVESKKKVSGKQSAQ